MGADSIKLPKGEPTEAMLVERPPGSKPKALRNWAKISRESNLPQTALRFEEAADEIERLTVKLAQAEEHVDDAVAENTALKTRVVVTDEMVERFKRTARFKSAMLQGKRYYEIENLALRAALEAAINGR